ncbi:MAG: hypothetical protein OQL19_21535 [Gammaproteobacteria bacterium]|nr:hypothetical protein [Gammaproteobacteria bacterium]
MSHDEAKNVIVKFNSEIYKLWRKFSYDNDLEIKGRTFSDSLIIYTQGTTEEHLRKLLDFLVELYRVSITICDLPLRGGISVGEHDDINAVEFNNLQKGMVVGNAFIDAYALESSYDIKGSKILFKQEINLKINKKLNGYTTQKVKKDSNGNEIYELKWGDITFLVENNYESLNKFIDLGCHSKWLNQYYGTLETFLIKEKPEDKSDIYIKIIERIKKNYKYTDLDYFIENFMKSECSSNFKKSFLAFIRSKI